MNKDHRTRLINYESVKHNGVYLHTNALVISSNKAKIFTVCAISNKLAILS